MLICIDAGHYIGTPGKRCLKSIDPGETREWTLNSRVADKLEAILAGYDCQTMRVDDVTGKRDVTLSQRVAAANRAKADVYLSIHHNAGINGGSGGGIVAYVAPKHQKQSEVVRDAVYRYTVAATGLRGNRAQPLAEQSLYVLNYTTMPATLIELGFMDSTHDTPIILTEQFADQAAAGLAAALVEVYDLQARRRLEPVATLSAEEFRVEVVAAAKRSIAGDYINAGLGNSCYISVTARPNHLVCGVLREHRGGERSSVGLCVTVQGQGGGIQVDAGGRRNKTVLGTLISVPDRLQHRILIAIGACFSDNSLSAVEQSIIGKGHQIFCTVTRVLAHGIMDTDRSISVNGVVRYGDQGVLGTVQIRGTPVASNLNRHIAVA